ncbi:MAG: hypothetical protein R2699_12630 [Acidimicrobiales bacterium]
MWFIQAKYDSTCVLNTAPATLVDDLLRDEGAGQRPSWYEEVAPRELQAYWRIVRGRAPIDGLPSDVRDLDRDHRLALKHWMRSTEPSVAEHDAYLELCRAVSEQTAQRWRRHLAASSPAQRTQLLFRMLRIAGGRTGCSAPRVQPRASGGHRHPQLARAVSCCASSPWPTPTPDSPR